MDMAAYIFLTFVFVCNFNHGQTVLNLMGTRKPPPQIAKDQIDQNRINNEPDVCRVKVQCSNDARIPFSLLDGTKGETKSTGFPGLPGSKGKNGTKGDKGDVGIPGLPGSNGKNGTKGDKGDVGFPGLPGSNGQNGIKGDKGDIGFPGLPGSNGQHGTKGDKGDVGTPGLIGPKGDKGDSGDKGENGTSGSIGLTGENGKTGQKGEPGTKGEHGRDGLKGLKGDPGERGFSGLNGLKGETGGKGVQGIKGETGKCSCKDDDTFSNGEDDEIQYKSPYRPAKSCRDLKQSKESSGEVAITDSYYVNKEESFEVTCNFENGLMCLNNKNLMDPVIVRGSKEFWLSEYNFDINKFYGINYRQLQWFQFQAKSTISLEVRVHCENLSVNPKNKNETLQVMSWNGNLIDFQRTAENPLFYSISNDGCKDTDEIKEEMKFSEIKIKGTANSLPITDFYFRNIKPNREQSVRVELVNLCADL